jgi:hypothetical protein
MPATGQAGRVKALAINGWAKQKRQPQLPFIAKPDAAQPGAGCRLARNITS